MSSLLTQTETNAWYRTPLGQKILSLEQQQINTSLARVFGYYAVSLGAMAPRKWDACPVRNKIELLPEPTNIPSHMMCMDFQQLACPDNSIDLFVLPHTLQQTQQPPNVLSEVARCLIPQGAVFIIGFNPYSLFGAWRWLQSPSQKFPWNGHYFSQSHLCTQLAKMDLMIEASQCFYFRPPINQLEALMKLRFLEALGPILWPHFGSVYTILARKQVGSLTPLKSSRMQNKTLSDYATTRSSSTLPRISHDD